MTIANTFDDALYFRETGKSDHRSSLGFLSLQIITVVIVVEIKWLWFTILSSDNRVCSPGGQDENLVVFPFALVGMSELRNVAPPGFVEGGLGGSHREIMEMVHDGVEF